MTGIRLLMAISLVCSASAFAQTKTDAALSFNTPDAGKSVAASNSEPWKILTQSPAPQSLPTASFPTSQMHRSSDPFLISRSDILNGNIDPNIVVRDSAAGADAYCLKIRSYVVARDSKNSDSVHPVGYTTCVPASRFRLKTATIDQNPER
jgi:hypothetical protein